MTQVAIYTALYGNYEPVKPMPDGMTVPCILLTDDPGLVAPGWQVVHAPGRVTLPGRDGPMMQAKWWKTHPVEALGVAGVAADVSCWIDASMTLVSADYPALCLDALGGDDWSMVRHPGRDCIYDEADFSLTLPRYQGIGIEDQVEYYRTAVGHPKHWGLFACGANVRRHTAAVEKLCGQWWWECATRTWQDQVSLPVLVRLAGSELKWNVNIPWSTWWAVQDHSPA